MIAHGKDIKIFSGTSNRPLAEAIERIYEEVSVSKLFV